ncbi:MAG TPA: hypothetical protein VFJ96_01335 [Gemmatimonadaceae bacterium]|nr:hypothetical protein [Gemmatimonadaceae bacterium]
MQAVPYFQADGNPAQEQSRLLLLSYHFPPSQATGALRWQKLIRYAAARSWGVDVVTLDPECLRDADPRRLADLPAGVRVYGVPAIELRVDRVENIVWGWCRPLVGRLRTRTSDNSAHVRHHPRPMSFGRHEVRWYPRAGRDILRPYYAMLDFDRGDEWADRATSLALQLVQPRVHRAVISCGPPHMVHDAGRRISQLTGLPLIMDLRDPWSFMQRIPEAIAHPLWWRLAQRHERRAVAQATLVVANTELARREFVRRYPEWRERFLSVMNGYDWDTIPETSDRSRFIIAYAGSIYLDRDPRLLFRAAARVIAELELSPDEFGFEFIGHVERDDELSLHAIAREEGIEAYVSAGPPRPRREAMEFLSRAAMLVSLPQDSDMAIPSKIFEYMQFDAWLLALVHPDSATGLLLQGTDADVVAPHDVNAIAAVLHRRYLEHARGIRPRPIARDKRFSRAHQAALLFDAIEECVGQPGAALAPSLGTAATLTSVRP